MLCVHRRGGAWVPLAELAGGCSDRVPSLGLGVLTPQRATPRMAWSVEARIGRRVWKPTRMPVLLWPPPRRKGLLAWRVAQKVTAGDVGFRRGRGLGQGHSPLCVLGAAWACCLPTSLAPASGSVPEGGRCCGSDPGCPRPHHSGGRCRPRPPPGPPGKACPAPLPVGPTCRSRVPGLPCLPSRHLVERV